jgi:hypothetical protein
MTRPPRANLRVYYRLVAVLGALAVLIVVFVLLRRPILREAGRALTYSDPIDTADMIVVTEWDAEGGLLEAADLVHAGIARQVAILLTPVQPADSELERRGIHREPISQYLTGILHGLGVQAVEIIPRRADGTTGEGDVLPAWCDERQFRTVIVVSSPDHSRRVRRVLHRSMRHHRTKIVVRTAAFSDFDPDRWWQTHDGSRLELQGMGKLLVDLIRHPIS